jgi:glyoxylase I family protein
MSDGHNAKLGGGGFHHVALRSADFDASVAFYTSVLGFREALRWGDGDGQAIMLDAGQGACLEIFAGGDGKAADGRPILHFALNCEDVDGVIARVRQAGMDVTMEPKDVDIPSQPPTGVRIAFFKGPDGELVELFHRRC